MATAKDDEHRQQQISSCCCRLTRKNSRNRFQRQQQQQQQHQQQQRHQHAQFHYHMQQPPQLRPPAGSRAQAAADTKSDIIVAGKYRLLSRIGHGSFGELYRACGLQYGEEVAVKLENALVSHPLLPREAKIYGLLRGSLGFPHIKHYGTEGVFNVLVLDLLGPTLEDLLNFCARKFSMKTTLMLADQMLARVEYIHLKCFIHRDIKPDNFLMGLGRQRARVFMIDFGLAKKFYSSRTKRHIGYSENHDLVGTARYASVRAHYAEQGRRDDLESVGYLLLYFRRGHLPWQGIKAESRQQKYEKIAEKKSSIALHSLCGGLPIEFFMYLKYCRSLHFAEQPDYMYLRQLFKVLFRRNYFHHDFLFDWVDLEREASEKMKKRRCSCRYHKHQHREQKLRERSQLQEQQEAQKENQTGK
ncbi:casein kinase I [Drosophila willistoni]|nr:casein kinase I [Drosophila willistoni]